MKQGGESLAVYHRKKSLIIHVPVTDAGSGVERISYTMTPEDASGNPDSSKARTKTASVENGKAQITFPRTLGEPLPLPARMRQVTALTA